MNKRFLIITTYQPNPEKLPDVSISFAEKIPHHIEMLAKYPDHKICIVDTLLSKSFYL